MIKPAGALFSGMVGSSVAGATAVQTVVDSNTLLSSPVVVSVAVIVASGVAVFYAGGVFGRWKVAIDSALKFADMVEGIQEKDVMLAEKIQEMDSLRQRVATLEGIVEEMRRRGRGSGIA